MYLRFLAGAALVTVLGCSPVYTYWPSQNATATASGHAAADYQIPWTAPEGEVRVASFGFTGAAPPNAPANQTMNAFQVRMIVANNGAGPWQIDTREQLIDLPGVGKIQPLFARARDGSPLPPLVDVAPGGRRTIDLFYRLPAGHDRTDNLPRLDEIWRVHTTQETIVARTSFNRLRVEQPSEYGHEIGEEWAPRGTVVGPSSSSPE